MTKTILSILLLTLATACTSTDYKVGLDREVTVGATMIQKSQWAYGVGTVYNTLVYVGKEGSTVFIAHRVFNEAGGGNVTDYRFDLSHSNVITVQGVRLQVLSATPDTIRFKVLETDAPARVDHYSPTSYAPGDVIELERAS